MVQYKLRNVSPITFSFPKREMMEPGHARAKANWLRLFSRVRLQLQEVGCVYLLCVSDVEQQRNAHETSLKFNFNLGFVASAPACPATAPFLHPLDCSIVFPVCWFLLCVLLDCLVFI